MQEILGNTNLLMGAVLMLTGVLDVMVTKLLLERVMKKASGGELKPEQSTVLKAMYTASFLFFVVGVYFYQFQPLGVAVQP